MSAPSLASSPDLDAERRRALRRMRSLAVGLLVFAALVYLVTLGQEGFLGFVNAGAEASMVGAIADWFAVVALFKHPLGLPVPHTALIPERKAMLGRSLEEFVGENFLSDEIVANHVLEAQPSAKAGEWLSHEEHSRRVVLEAADLLGLALRRVRDEDVADLIQSALVPRFKEEPISPLAGRLLEEVVEDGAHHGLVDLLLEEAGRWLEGNEQTFHEVVVERAPWWAPDSVNERVIRRLHAELVTWIGDIRREPYHRSRLALDRVLRQVAQDLLTDEPTIERMERFKVRMLEHPQTSATYISLWNALRRALVQALDDPDGELVRRGVSELQAFGERLCGDEGLRARLDKRASDLAVFLVDRYGRELTSVITHTIDEWDGQEASRKIELHVGKDLQFIRINGTIVGGLVGVLIHAVSVALS
ncbi:DUF445 domain-containing protein [Nocardioides marmoribigeumensis]|uniref:Uncharacterized membrane-anchored protein YjiN (DUF445 family) n=1 Tax=Nocardioides marmoribigeumensis TaxID=433649 RepID=A0ABU2BYS0_9ACTN|nr:DUF445 domain-containing protein [Nocardioides marmoribigeumensis]MDR7363553.1 uncharacterized membrane-anchored protein YjiN (DUF445 family) [Nocardioides marmoribigeumensis]